MIRASENESVRVSFNYGLKPFGLGQRADKDEKRRGGKSLLLIFRRIKNRDRLEMLLAVQLNHRGPQTYLDILYRLDLINQIAKHTFIERFAPDQHSYRAGITGEV